MYLICYLTLTFYLTQCFSIPLINLPKNKQSIITGPIIGKVTEDTARILVEFAFDDVITMVLSYNDDGIVTKISDTQVVQAFSPVIFKFSNLLPSLKYSVSFDPDLSPINDNEVSFKTLKGKIDNNESFKIIFISCNDVRYGEQVEINLWSDLAERAKKGEIDFIIHFGDQVYLDHNIDQGNTENVYARTQSLLKDENYTNYDNYKEIVKEMIRMEYRRTFNFKATAEVLALVPNMMFLDDHDVYDDFGFKKTELDPKSLDYFFINQARYVYYQYQRQLREDVDLINFKNNTAEFDYFIINNIGFFVLDIRAWKVFNLKSEVEAESSMIGSEQWDAFNKAFNSNDNGIFNNVDAALLVSTIPLIITNKTIADWAVTQDNDYQEIWNYQHPDELRNLLDKIREWKSTMGKEIIIIGGDYHYGWHTEIYYKKEPFLKQFVTSGINQSKTTEKEAKDSDTILFSTNFLFQDYCFYHHDRLLERNYGIVELSKKNSTIEILSQLITTDTKTSIVEENIISNNNFMYFSNMADCE